MKDMASRVASRWVGWHEDDDRAWDKNKAKLPETTRLSDLKFEIKGSGPWIVVKVSAGDGWVGVIESTLVDQDEMLENGWVSLAQSLRAFGESVGRPEMGVYAVSHSDLWHLFHGYGAGKRAYTMLLKEAHKRGHAAGPHGSWQNKGFRLTSDDAQRVWRKLGKMPGVKVADDHPFYYGDPRLERVGPDRPRGFQRGKKKYRRGEKHPHAQRAAQRHLEAGLIEPPPKMVEVIMKTKKKMASRVAAKLDWTDPRMEDAVDAAFMAQMRLQEKWPHTPLSELDEYRRKGKRHPNDVAYERERNKLWGQHLRGTGWTEAEVEDYINRRVAAKYQNKKQVDKADGSGKTTVYEYSKGQVDHRNREKAKRIEGLKGNISKLRSKVKTDLTDTDPKVWLTALAISLMDETCERVGNDESAEERGHFGVTTLQAKHVKINGGKATLTYTGKSGVKHTKTVTNSGTVKALKKALKGKSGDDTILCEGDDCIVRANDVNDYLKEYDITAKDIRGYRANDEMVRQLKEQRGKGKALPNDRKEKDEILKAEFTKALEATAKLVGHESSTLRSQYLVPKLEDSYVHDGTVMDKWDKTASASPSVVVRRHLEASAALIDDNVDAFEKHFKLLSVLVDAHLRGDRQDAEIHNTWKVMIPRGREVMKGVLSTKEIPKRSAKPVEMAARMLGNAKHYSVPRNFFKWWDKNKKRFQVVLEAAKFADKTMGGEALFKIGKLTVHNTLAATGEELKDFKKALVAASRLIKRNNGAVPGGLSKVLYGEVYYVGQLTRAHHAAWYNPSDDILYIRPPKAKWGMDMVETIIHEFGHRYYGKFAPTDMKKAWYGHHLYGVKRLENDWEFQGLEVGEQIPMRVRGAPRGWRPVVSGVEGGFYLYEHWDNDGSLVRTDKLRIDNWRRKQESKAAIYPTRYAATDEDEHFCESLKLLCAGKLPTPHLNAFEAIWGGGNRSASSVASRWLKKASSGTELHLYDFDGTLFRSPHKPDWWGAERMVGQPAFPE